jgi:hypothetical protein
MNGQAALAQLKPYFRFPLQDAQARTRFVVGCALLLAGFIVPFVPGIIVSGYALRILRSTGQGEPPSMPPWEDWSSFLSLGFRGGIIGLVFMLPGLAFFLLGFVLYFATFALIPIFSAAQGSTGDTIFAAALLAMGAMMLSTVMGSLLLALGTIPLPASLAHFIAKDKLGAAFEIRQWWPVLSSNGLGYLIAFVVSAGVLAVGYFAFLLLYSTLVLACLSFLVMIPFGFYAMLLGGSLFGECYREGCDIAGKAMG